MRLVLLPLLLGLSCSIFAQKETFDIIEYKQPAGWQKNIKAEAISFSKEKDNNFCMMILYKSIDGSADAQQNFNKSWEHLAQNSFNAEKAAMQPASTDNGWDIRTGSALFEKDGLKGSVVLITGSKKSKVANILILTNTDAFQQEMEAFLDGIVLKEIPAAKINNSPANNKQNNSLSHNRLTGLWRNNVTETSGYFNGKPNYTAGYTDKEYNFKSDGTYTFLHKMWLTSLKNIFFVYETGTWSIIGNKLTLTPRKSKAEEWRKAGSDTKKWGSLVKSGNRQLVQTVYTFDIYTDDYGTTLSLQYSGSTGREPDNVSKLSYSLKTKEGSLITLPPGFKF